MGSKGKGGCPKSSSSSVLPKSVSSIPRQSKRGDAITDTPSPFTTMYTTTDDHTIITEGREDASKFSVSQLI
eukprot:11019139-Ditylum_brightwellii.AAC.1